MCQTDCIIIDVLPNDNTKIMCPMCCESVSCKNMAQLCKNNIYHHKICYHCVSELKQNGFGNGCVYCGDRLKENNIIVPAVNPNISDINSITITNNRNVRLISINSDNLCGIIFSPLFVLLIVFIIYAFGIIVFYIGQKVFHFLHKEDHSHVMEYTIKNCVIGWTGWLCAVYISIQIILILNAIFENICLPCYKKLCLPCYKKICFPCFQNIFKCRN